MPRRKRTRDSKLGAIRDDVGQDDPYYKFWAHLFISGLLEAVGVGTVNGKSDDFKRDMRLTRARIEQEWIWNDKDRHPGSFLFCCELFNLPPNKVRMRYNTREAIKKLAMQLDGLGNNAKKSRLEPRGNQGIVQKEGL